MKLCERCSTYEVMPVPMKDSPSVPEKMDNSPSGGLSFFFPTEPGKLCYFCQKVVSGRISKE